MTGLKIELPRLTLDLGEGVTAFSTLRGDIKDINSPYEGFNACDYSGDDPKHVNDCRHRLATAVDMPLENIVIPRQTHSANVAILTEPPQTPLEGTDAMVTKRPDLMLAINTADCLPVTLYDPENRIVGIAHAGWKGILNGIITATINAMTAIGASPQKIHAAIGPSICGDCYEVSSNFTAPFIKQFSGLNGLIKSSEPKPHINLAIAARHQMSATEIRPENIAMPPLCSRCNPGLFFSARALGQCSGRTLTAIRLNR